MQVLGAARAELMSSEEVAAVRPGYQFPGEGAPVPAIIVAVVPGTPRHAIDVAFLAQQYRVPFSVADATPEEQLAALGRFDPVITFGVDLEQFSPFERLLSHEEQPVEFAPPRVGSYLALDPPALPLVDGFMDVTICVSPDVGWGELERFLACTRQRLTVSMYQFTAPHIFRALHDVLAPPDRTLSLVLHPSPEPPAKFGVKAQDMREEDVLAELAGTMGDRFSVSWATVVSKRRPAGLWASAVEALGWDGASAEPIVSTATAPPSPAQPPTAPRHACPPLLTPAPPHRPCRPGWRWSGSAPSTPMRRRSER
jgi:hypothetical protein